MLRTHAATLIIAGCFVAATTQGPASPDELKQRRDGPSASKSDVVPKKSAVPTAVDQSRKDAALREFSRPRTFAPSNDETKISELLKSIAVQKEVKITSKQANELDVLSGSQFERIRPWMEMRMNSSSDPEAWAAADSMCKKMTHDFDQELKGFLRRDQARRLSQISIQRAGDRALLMPEVADALALEPETRTAIRNIFEDAAAKEKEWVSLNKEAELREYSKLEVKSWENFRKSPAYLNMRDQQQREMKVRGDNTHRQIYGLLLAAQRRKFENMRGEPFDPEVHRLEEHTDSMKD